MSLARRIASNTLIQILGRVLTTATALVVVGALTRYLGVAGYGEYTTIFAYVSFFGVLADFGFFWIMLREISKDGADESSIISNVLTLRTVLGIIVFALGYLIALFIPQYSAEIRAGIGIIAFAWLWLALNSTFVGVFQRHLRMDQAVLTDILGRVVVLVGVLWIIAQGGTLSQMLWVFVLGNFLNFIASLVLGTRFVKIRPAFDFALWKRIAFEAWPMGVVLILHVIYFKIDTVMLSLMKDSVAVGIYGAPYKILEVLLTVPVMFLGNVFPTLTRYIASKDKRLPRIFQQSFDVLAIIALPLVMGTLILARPILAFVAGDEFVTTSTIQFLGSAATGATALQILILAVGTSFFSNFFNYVLIAMGRQRQLIAPNALFVGINIGTNLIAIPALSYIGASLTTVVTEVAITTVLGWMVWRHLKLAPSLSNFGSIALASLAMGAVTWLLAGFALWIPVLAAVIVYPLFLWFFGAISPDLIASIKQRGDIEA